MWRSERCKQQTAALLTLLDFRFSQLTQSSNRNQAARQLLGRHCRSEEHYPGAAEEMANMRVHPHLHKHPYRHLCSLGSLVAWAAVCT